MNQLILVTYKPALRLETFPQTPEKVPVYQLIAYFYRY